MMTEHRRTVWLLALILAVPALASAVRQGRLIGKLVDPEGKPIPGVTVTITSPGDVSASEIIWPLASCGSCWAIAGSGMIHFLVAGFVASDAESGI